MMNRSYFQIAVLLMALTVLLSCKDSGGDIVNVSSYIVIQEATTPSGVARNNFYEQTSTPTRENFTIVIDSVAQSEPVTVEYSLSGTAEFGKHIETIELQGSVTIPAGSRTATVDYSILTENFSFGEQYNITIRLNSVRGGNVRINSSYASFTNIIGISCQSTLVTGIYTEQTENKQVSVEDIGNNVYRISNLNFGYYIGPEYGEIPGEFADQCGKIILQGTEIEEKYGVAWVGSGTWSLESKELTVTVSDKTFNPDYKITLTFKHSP